ncbi:MarR family winged helix-turn-helix transcriptional regulator [Pseudomonas sp. NCHU5208]|uniref:MarR family winged helix-turn-helix transcriptional regulator n=1 Tax=unclassified Pseudomonas TaxID=196821 RepID=UPI003F987A8B
MNFVDATGLHAAPLRDLICFNFYRGWRGVSEFYRQFLPEGVSAQQSYLLELCEQDRGLLVNEIANQLEIEISAISGMLRRMEGAGLIHREVMPSNRRQTQVFLTAKGEELRATIRTAMVEADRVMSQAINREDRVHLTKVVDQIRTLLELEQF